MSIHIPGLTFEVTQPKDADENPAITVTGFGEPWARWIGHADVRVGIITESTNRILRGNLVHLFEVSGEDLYDALPDVLYTGDDDEESDVVFQEAAQSVAQQFADRIIACVNALAGIPSEVIASPDFAAWLKFGMSGPMQGCAGRGSLGDSVLAKFDAMRGGAQ